MKKDLAILIPVFNEIYFTKQCLRNLEESIKSYYKNQVEALNVSIVLIDDGSTDGTSLWVNENYPAVIILKGDGNLFWSKSINLGIEYCLNTGSTSHILFWNKDLYIEEDYLCLLHKRIFNVNTNVIIASKMLRKNMPNVLFSNGGLFNSRTGKKINIGSGEIDSEKYNVKTQIDWCGGMAVCIPIDVFNEIGGCDAENFPQYDGDTDFFLRASGAGFNLFLFPELKAWNIHENTGKKVIYNLKNYFWYINDIRSFQNFKIAFRFLNKHTKGFLPYINFTIYYIVFSFKYFLKILISYFK